MPLYQLLILILMFSGLVLGGLMLTWRSKAADAIRIRPEPERKLVGTRVAIRMALNSLFSSALIFGICLGLYEHLFYEAMPVWWRFPLEAIGLLFVYDFLYYFLHRYPFHEFGPLRRVHAIHHTARYPIAIDSLFLHPVENFLGLALLMSCVFLVGPIHIYSFAAAFFVYSQLNIFVHSGLAFSGPLAYFGFIARKHDHHHKSMRGMNFASLTPLPDIIFGTAE
jgi:sterol desaturase/sphingolipid hydroxylase (fatty acid hydroxylase superfamily)